MGSLAGSHVLCFGSQTLIFGAFAAYGGCRDRMQLANVYKVVCEGCEMSEWHVRHVHGVFLSVVVRVGQYTIQI